jgi:colicin import membrane protein
METGLAMVREINAITFFQPGASTDVLEKLKIEVRTEAAKLGISTVANRKAIASLAAKVAKTKTGLEAAGKDLVAGEKKRLKLIDDERGKVWDELQALQDEVRKPLTDWEQADKIRVAALEFKVVAMSGLASIPFGASTAEIEAKIAEVDALDMSNMQEFTSRAALAEKQTREYLAKALAEAQRRDAEAAETKLRAEAAERERKEREAALQQAAYERAQKEAEAERLRVEEEKFQAEARAKQAEAARIESERLAEERRVDAEARAKQEAEEAAKRHAQELAEAEERRVDAEARAKQEAEEAAKRHAQELAEAEERREQEAKDAIECEKSIQQLAAEKAERDRQAAIEAERERVAAEARKAAAEAEAREKDKKHKSAVMGAAKDALMAAGIPEEHAKAAVLAIQRGQVPAVSISF